MRILRYPSSSVLVRAYLVDGIPSTAPLLSYREYCIPRRSKLISCCRDWVAQETVITDPKLSARGTGAVNFVLSWPHVLFSNGSWETLSATYVKGKTSLHQEIPL